MPQHLWQPLQERSWRFASLSSITSAVAAGAAGIGGLLTAFAPAGWRPTIVIVGAVVILLAIVEWAVVFVVWRRTLRQMRALMIEYHGIDPGGP